MTHFSSLMPDQPTGTANREARAAAVSRAKARVQAHISMPPTPPHETAPSSAPGSLTGVQNLMKRLSSTYLGVSTSLPGAPLQARGSSNTSSSSSSSGYTSYSSDGSSNYGDSHSEAGSLTSDSGCSSPASSEISTSSECESDFKNGAGSDFSECRFPVQPVPAYAYGQGRKVSTASTCTVKSDATVSSLKSSGIKASESPSSSPDEPSHGVPAYGAGRGHPLRSKTFGYGPANREIPGLPSSTTMPALPRNASVPSGGFLSRMWGAATKAQDKDREGADACEPPTEPHGTSSAFRRLAHSKSALLRSQHAREVGV